MDFGALLHYAKKKNDAACKDEGKYYSTKYAPPKKESKESKQLSNNIQKFLKNREAEEQQRRREEREKLNNLLALRDEKSKNKIRKMLKVTKSANKSVLEDAKNADNTELDGTDQPDGDDYGYVSTEANAFYQKYIEKVKDVQEDKGFAPSRPQSVRDLSSTKERVKAAITRERDEAKNHTRARTSHASTSRTSSSTSTTDKDGTQVARAYSTTSSKTLYDPEAERRDEERKRRDEEQKKAKVKRATQAPPMDFQALLRLAEKKQHEPLQVAMPEKKKEPERLLSAREKKEQEERQRWKEQRAQRDRQREIDAKTKVEPTRMEPGGRIPKLNKSPVAKVGKVASASMPPPSPHKSKPTSDSLKRPASASPGSGTSAKYSAVTPKSSPNPTLPKRLPTASSSSVATKSPASATASTKTASISQAKPAPSRNPYADANKNNATRSFPPREPTKQPRPFPPGDMQRIKTQPGAARGRGGAAAAATIGATRRPVEPVNKNRIYDDDSEYDSELDDFIDDGDCEEDISSHIRDIFGYDKRRYRDLDDDDAQMESSFAQVQREEFISKKLGLQEDLEDMRMEAMHKKQKMDKRRPARIHDD